MRTQRRVARDGLQQALVPSQQRLHGANGGEHVRLGVCRRRVQRGEKVVVQ